MIPDQKSWGAVLRQISTSSAVNPTMLVSIAAMIFGYLGLQFAPEQYASVFIFLLLSPLIVFLAQVVFFTLKEPDRLQDDKLIEQKMKHVEQKMLIEHHQVIGVMNDGKPVEIELSPRDRPMANPLLTIEGDKQ